MNRRASFLFDSMFIIIGLLAVVIAALSMHVMLSKVNTAFQNDSHIPSEAKQDLQTGVTQYDKVMDFWIVLFLVGLPLISMGLAYFTSIPSIFFWLSVAASLFVTYVAWAFQSLWESMLGVPDLASAAASMPVSSWIFSHYVIYSLYVLVAIGVGTYAKVGA